jgi:hypothetical protein
MAVSEALCNAPKALGAMAAAPRRFARRLCSAWAVGVAAFGNPAMGNPVAEPG